ncbi:MAG TPA: hypothetical protein VEQ58_03100 [Polyangiaceae bacterium]|nr:hypothetical protein [Polyangiaceae bacterium]
MRHQLAFLLGEKVRVPRRLADLWKEALRQRMRGDQAARENGERQELVDRLRVVPSCRGTLGVRRQVRHGVLSFVELELVERQAAERREAVANLADPGQALLVDRAVLRLDVIRVLLSQLPRRPTFRESGESWHLGGLVPNLAGNHFLSEQQHVGKLVLRNLGHLVQQLDRVG